MKTQVLFLGFVSGLSYSIAQTCNDGFESNSFAGWQGATGTNAGNYSITITGTTISSPRFSIEGVATGTIICAILLAILQCINPYLLMALASILHE